MNLFFYLQTFILNYSFIVILSDHILYFVLLKQPFVKRKPVKTGGKKISERSRSAGFTVLASSCPSAPFVRMEQLGSHEDRFP